jgi:hypothetical protein
VSLSTRNPGQYTVEGYAEYLRDGRTERTNEVRAVLTVK